MTTDTTPTTDQAPGPVLELVEVDPATLVIGANVRPGKPTKAFVASIKARGVLEPVVAYRDDQSQLVVWRGQRRTLGAIEAGRPVIPVVVVAKPADVDRLVDQIVENEHREAMTGKELAGGYGQLAAWGMTAGQIATQTSAGRAAVKAGLTVAASELATRTAERYELTLDQAAGIAEFDQDAETVTALVAASKVGQFDHVLQQARDQRAEQAAIAEAAAALTERGVHVIEEPGRDSPVLTVDRLAHDGQEVTEESHRGCPGHAAYLATGWYWGSDDGGDEDYKRRLSAIYVCTDPAGNGHTDRWATRNTAAPGGQSSEQDKAERRRVIDGNKAFRSATTVRREWLRTFAARKTPPPGAERFVLVALLHGDDSLRRAMGAGNHHRWLRVLLGMAEEDEAKTWGAGLDQIAQITEQADSETPKRALLLAVALLLAAWEDRTGPHTWRQPGTQDRRYLAAMAQWGYPLSEIEAPIVAPAEAVD